MPFVIKRPILSALFRVIYTSAKEVLSVTFYTLFIGKETKSPFVILIPWGWAHYQVIDLALCLSHRCQEKKPPTQSFQEMRRFAVHPWYVGWMGVCACSWLLPCTRAVPKLPKICVKAVVHKVGRFTCLASNS